MITVRNYQLINSFLTNTEEVSQRRLLAYRFFQQSNSIPQTRLEALHARMTPCLPATSFTFNQVSLSHYANAHSYHKYINSRRRRAAHAYTVVHKKIMAFFYGSRSPGPTSFLSSSSLSRLAWTLNTAREASRPTPSNIIQRRSTLLWLCRIEVSLETVRQTNEWEEVILNGTLKWDSWPRRGSNAISTRYKYHFRLLLKRLGILKKVPEASKKRTGTLVYWPTSPGRKQPSHRYRWHKIH